MNLVRFVEQLLRDTKSEILYGSTPMELPKADAWAWDMETAINGGIVDYPTMLSCASDSHSFVAIGEDNIRSLGHALRDSGATLVTWNGWAFDEPVMKRWGIEMPMSHDGMVMAYFDDETQALGLESCAVKYLGVKGWKHGDWKTFDPTSEEAAQYAARDARYTLLLFAELRSRLGRRMATIDRIVAPARKALDKQTERGIFINPIAVQRERESAISIRELSLNELLSAAGPKFNPNSTKQVGEFLLRGGVRLPLTETGKPSTSVETLQSVDSEFCKTLLEYRGAVKVLNTYVEPYESCIVSGGGRVHPEYTLIRTLTGRSSAKNLNVQQLPRAFKDFFGAPAGRLFVECDYSAIEFRIAAWFAQEKRILESYSADPGWDPHRFVAALFYGKKAEDVTKDERQIAKSANFGLLYLGNGYTLYEYANKQGVKMSMETAEEIYRFWHMTFPGFKKFYHETKEELKETGQVEGPTGQIRHFGDFSLVPQYKRLECLRQAVNFKVQNLSAHVAYIAMAELERIHMPTVGFVHDAVLFEFSNEKELENAMPNITSAMVNHPRDFLRHNFDINLNIPLAIESKIHHG
jgi:DNA polymerase I